MERKGPETRTWKLALDFWAPAAGERAARGAVGGAVGMMVVILLEPGREGKFRSGWTAAFLLVVHGAWCCLLSVGTCACPQLCRIQNGKVPKVGDRVGVCQCQRAVS